MYYMGMYRVTQNKPDYLLLSSKFCISTTEHVSMIIYVNFDLLAAEIVSLVWGTPANFNGFRVLASLLHGTPVLGVSQTLRR